MKIWNGINIPRPAISAPKPCCGILEWRFLSPRDSMSFSLMPHFPRCERTQHKITMAESGSLLAFAAQSAKVRKWPS
jgi:hypothetical protein